MPEYDVFLAHNGHDKNQAEELATLLRDDHGLNVWFDKWCIPPGSKWQDAMEQGIRQSKSGGVLVGRDGLSPWANEEMQGLLQFAVRQKLSVIPVLLPGREDIPELPVFLSSRHYVDMREGFTEELVKDLVWGITDSKRQSSSNTVSDQSNQPTEPSLLKRKTMVVAEESLPAGYKLVPRTIDDLKRPLKIAAFGPHVDDIELGCGATLARLRDQFDASIFYYIFSSAVVAWDGERTIEEGGRIRDAKRAFLLMVNGTSAGEEEGHISPLSVFDEQKREVGRFTYFTLQDTRMDADEIRKKLRHVQTHELSDVDLVFVPSFKDVHQDHRAMGISALQIFRKQENVLFYKTPDSGKHPQERFNPNLYVDVSHEVEPEGLYSQFEKIINVQEKKSRATYADVKLQLLQQFNTETDKPWYREDAFCASMIENANDAYLPLSSEKDKYAEGFECVLRI